LSSDPEIQSEKPRKRRVRRFATLAAGGGLAAAALGASANPALAGEPTAAEGQPGTGTTTTEGTATNPQPPATPEPPKTSEPAPPKVIVKQRQRPAPKVKGGHSSTPTSGKHAHSKSKGSSKSKESGNVANAPGSVAQLSALQALLSSSQTSSEALQFYRIPLFLLPIYKAAAVQYGVPWQVLAAINEIETNYGTDLNVSSAGAVGWMQFMPATWLQYGVDALEAGYADPFNPVDAVFAAARYLRAAGAQSNLTRAIFAYNHSQEYVESVLLRAKLIATYPRPVLETLTGMVDGALPVSGHHVTWTVPKVSASAATALAPNPVAPLPRTRAAARAALRRAQREASQPPVYATVRTAAGAHAVAVQDGRVVRIGHAADGYYLVLRDIYGDQYTYAGLRSVAKTFSNATASLPGRNSIVVQAASTKGPAPARAASAGAQQPHTIVPASPRHSAAAAIQRGGAYVPEASASVPAGMGRVRLYAHPRNPDARVAAKAARARAQAAARRSQRLAVGSVLARGTVIGTVGSATGGRGSIRFAVRPNGDAATINPSPLLENWAQLQKALHPAGARASNALLGATSSDVFLYSPAQLRRAVLSDPGITLGPCERRAIADGAVDSRLLAVLAYLSRSGLQPTVASEGCKAGEHAVSVDIVAINGIKIAGHQGAGSIADLTIRSLLTLPSSYAPQQILSLMDYPGQFRTKADAKFAGRIRVAFTTPPAREAHAARAAKVLPTVGITLLTPNEWSSLFTRIGSLQVPSVPTRPTKYALNDPPAYH
jgi:soluble lytic murein transglycosylase-like protein